MRTMSAKYVSSFDDWMDPWLLKLKSCGFLHTKQQALAGQPLPRRLATPVHGKTNCALRAVSTAPSAAQRLNLYLTTSGSLSAQESHSSKAFALIQTYSHPRAGHQQQGEHLSMKEVVAVPERNSGCRSTFSRNRMLVFTPRMWNSYNARCIFWMACRYVPDRTITCAKEFPGIICHASLLLFLQSCTCSSHGCEVPTSGAFWPSTLSCCGEIAVRQSCRRSWDAPVTRSASMHSPKCVCISKKHPP